MKNYVTTITIFSILLISGFAQSEVLVVDPSGGGDFLSLEEAVTEIVAGDTIEFVDGTHNVDSFVSITTPGIILKSASGNAQSCSITGSGYLEVIDPEISGEFSIEVHDLGFALESLFVNCDVLLHGCNLRNGNDFGMTFDTVNASVIENTFFENMQLTVYGNGITLRSCQLVDSVLNCTNYLLGSMNLEDCSFTGSSTVQIWRAESVLLDRCTITENDSDLLFEVAAINDLTVKSCMFSGNQLAAGPALLVGAMGPATSINIEDCSFRDNTSNGFITAGLGVVLADFGCLTSVSCENVDFVGNIGPNGSADAFVQEGCELYLNCCEIDEAEIGGEGLATISFDGCSVSSETTTWGDLKAMFR